MKLLVFCTQAEKGDLINLFSLSFGSHTVMTSTGKDLGVILQAFETEPKAVMSLTGAQAAMGFRVDPGTTILFSRDFPEGPEREQAAGRNKRVRA